MRYFGTRVNLFEFTAVTEHIKHVAETYRLKGRRKSKQIIFIIKTHVRKCALEKIKFWTINITQVYEYVFGTFH